MFMQFPALRRRFAVLCGRVFRRRSRPQDIPKLLNAEALQAAMREARFLHARHEVSVRSLTPGEIPGIPRRADGE